MAIELKLGVYLDCCLNRFTLSDQTGVYDASWNTGGWGGSNTITVSDVETSTLKITSPTGAEYGPYDVSSYIPSLDPEEVFYIDPLNVLSQSVGQAMDDGYWRFDWMVQGVYGISDTPFNFRCVKDVLVLCDVKCCVDRLNADMDPTCGCNNANTSKALKAHLTLESIEAANCCGKKEQAKALLVKLEDICNNNCKSC